jgi:hypothetical protein
MDKKPFESLDDELFQPVPDHQLGRVAAGYISSSGTTYEHTVIHGVVDMEFADD